MRFITLHKANYMADAVLVPVDRILTITNVSGGYTWVAMEGLHTGGLEVRETLEQINALLAARPVEEAPTHKEAGE